MRRHAPIPILLALLASPVFASSHSYSYAGGDYQPCDETLTHVVGRSGCRRFGQWSSRFILPLALEVGFVSHHYLAPISLTGMTGSQGYALTTDPSADRNAVASGPRIRFLNDFGWIFWGVEMDIQEVTAGPTMSGEIYGTAITNLHATSIFGAHAVWGVRQRLMFDSEVALGLDLANYYSGDQSVQRDDFAIQARETIGLWITPFIAVGVGAGLQLTDRHDHTLVVSLGLHLHPYGAQ